MKIVHVTLHRDRLLPLAKQERTFLLSLGHLANELNATTKFLNWAANAPAANAAVRTEDEGIQLIRGFPLTPVPVDPQILAAYAGRYES